MGSRVSGLVEIDSLRCFVKAHRPRGIIRRLVAEAGAGRALRELKVSLRLRRAGVSTPKPIAGGMLRAHDGRWEIAVFEEIRGAQSVHDIVLKQLASLRGRARRRLLDRYREPFAAFVADVIGAGCVHGDFHGGNILVTGERPTFHLVDLHSVRFARHPDPAEQAARALAQLDSLFSLEASVSERLSFAKAVLTRLGTPVEFRTFARRVIELSQRHRERLFRKRSRKCVSRSGRFVNQRRPGWRFWAKRAWSEAASIELPQWFDEIGRRGSVIKAGHTTTVFDVADQTDALPPLVVKRYNNLGFAYVVKHLCRRSRGLRAWRTANELETRRISTASPVAAIEFRRGLLLDRSFFVAERVVGSVTLPQYARDARGTPELSEARHRLARRLGKLLRRLHDAGFDHRDLKPSNVLVVERPDGPEPVLIDLDGIRRTGRVPDRRRARNLARLARGLMDEPHVSRWDGLRVLAGYVGSLDRQRGGHRLLAARIGEVLAQS
jgi:tRNA A-37 threonylcarbamoyl transferase component Bud32